MAIWASLSQELLFFTNDDDERYSVRVVAGFPRVLLRLNHARCRSKPTRP